MSYKLIVEDQAKRDAQVIYDWIAQRSPDGADRWFDALSDALEQLKDSTSSYGFAPENDDHSQEIRQCLFKTKRGSTYRAIYTFDKDCIYVLHIRGPGQRLMDSGEL